MVNRMVPSERTVPVNVKSTIIPGISMLTWLRGAVKWHQTLGPGNRKQFATSKPPVPYFTRSKRIIWYTLQICQLETNMQHTERRERRKEWGSWILARSLAPSLARSFARSGETKNIRFHCSSSFRPAQKKLASNPLTAA